MPAMRISMLLISALLFCGLRPAFADEALPLAGTATAADKPLGPLAPSDDQLDVLFAKLKKERAPESARAISDQIRETFVLSGSATVDMLMSNASKAASEKRYGAALDFLDQVTLLAPDFAEGFNRRATVHSVRGNLPKAMSDIARVLALEPRHLGALSALAALLAESGRDAQALKTWDTYLGYYPADRDAQKQALDLLNKLAGQKT